MSEVLVLVDHAVEDHRPIDLDHLADRRVEDVAVGPRVRHVVLGIAEPHDVLVGKGGVDLAATGVLVGLRRQERGSLGVADEVALILVQIGRAHV